LLALGWNNNGIAMANNRTRRLKKYQRFDSYLFADLGGVIRKVLTNANNLGRNSGG
jgi:hypothetical protein